MKGARSRVLAGAGSVLVLLVSLTWCLSSVSASEPSSGSVPPQNAAATSAYLKATFLVDRTIDDNVSASVSAEKAAAKQFGHECHGVLAGEPLEEPGPRSETHVTARARGALRRSELERQTIDNELDLTTVEAFYGPDRAAIEAYESQVAHLSWSNPKIVELIRYLARARKERMAPSVTSVCADMRAWAQSGYHALSHNSREFQAAQQARSQSAEPTGSVATLLKPYENAADRRLIRRTTALQKRLVRALSGGTDVLGKLRHTLGVPESPFEEHIHAPVLGHGTTADGGTFVVRREASSGRFFGGNCKHSVSVEIKDPSKGSGVFNTSSGGSVCLLGNSERKPSGSCGNDVQSIQVVVSASVRTVGLRLSNGRTITSRVVQVPRGEGGPGGVYVQAIRGYKVHPVSLTELDASGRAVKTLKVGFRCHPEGPSHGPTFVDLAHGRTPENEPFTIQGVLVHYGNHQTDFSLSLGAGGSGVANQTEGSLLGGEKPKTFELSLANECAPHPYAIIYGILSVPGDSVLAQTQTGLVPLTKVELAPSLHSKGPLFYGAFTAIPSELVVQRMDGTTLYTESLVTKAKEEAEFCEGYAEP